MVGTKSHKPHLASSGVSFERSQKFINIDVASSGITDKPLAFPTAFKACTKTLQHAQNMEGSLAVTVTRASQISDQSKLF